MRSLVFSRVPRSPLACRVRDGDVRQTALGLAGAAAMCDRRPSDWPAVCDRRPSDWPAAMCDRRPSDWPAAAGTDGQRPAVWWAALSSAGCKWLTELCTDFLRFESRAAGGLFRQGTWVERATLYFTWLGMAGQLLFTLHTPETTTIGNSTGLPRRQSMRRKTNKQKTCGLLC